MAVVDARIELPDDRAGRNGRAREDPKPVHGAGAHLDGNQQHGLLRAPAGPCNGPQGRTVATVPPASACGKARTANAACGHFLKKISIRCRKAGPPMIRNTLGMMKTIIGMVSKTGILFARSSSLSSMSLRSSAATTRIACASGVP